MAMTDTLLGPGLMAARFLQWASAVIVMGITSYFIHKFPKGQHVIYEEVIAVLSVAFFIPGLLSAFVKTIGRFSLLIDIIFSYLWLTSFIFMAQDYNWHGCSATAPGGKCFWQKLPSLSPSWPSFLHCVLPYSRYFVSGRLRRTLPTGRFTRNTREAAK